jgi:Bacterial archaeo-eukaryotic release factor family 2
MDLGFLSPVIDRPGPWATVWTEASYTAPDAAQQRELTARGIRERVGNRGADSATCDAIHDALAGPPPSGTPGARAGRFLLASGGEVYCDLMLAGPPRRSGEEWSALPHLTPLLGGLADDRPCLVAYIDRTGADLQLRGSTGPARGQGTVRGDEWPIHRTGRNNWSERHHRLRAENAWERNAESIAHAVQEAWDDSHAELLLLAGDARERHSVHDRLPAAIAERTYETDHGGRAEGASTRQIAGDVAHARAAWERRETEREEERYKSSGTPVTEGVPSLVEAAREHRIDTLFVHPRGSDLGREVWVGPHPDQLAVRSSEVQYLGETVSHPARADDALLRSSVATGANVVVVRDAGDSPVGGLGALLRWEEPPQAAPSGTGTSG